MAMKLGVKLKQETVKAIQELREFLEGRGLKFVDIDELIEYLLLMEGFYRRKQGYFRNFDITKFRK